MVPTLSLNAVGSRHRHECFSWCRPTQVVRDQRPLNSCVCRCVCYYYESNLVVGACKEMLKDIGLRNDGMLAHAVDPGLQLPQPLTHKVILKPTWEQQKSHTHTREYILHSIMASKPSPPRNLLVNRFSKLFLCDYCDVPVRTDN